MTSFARSFPPGRALLALLALLGLLLLPLLAGCRTGQVVDVPPAGPALSSTDPAELFATRNPQAVRRAEEIWSRRATDCFALVRARIWLAAHEPAAEERRLWADRAVEGARLCGEPGPGNPEAAYWLGAALGVRAQERRAQALGSLGEIQALFELAATHRPGLENGAPDRALALLYARAPGFPLGPGDPALAIDHARRALDEGPDAPPNLLALGEALLAGGRRAEAREALVRARDRSLLLAERGDPDAPEWAAESRELLSEPVDF